MGTKYFINRPNTHGKEKLFWKNKDSVLFQWLSFSVERSERDHQLQDIIPQHCGESATGRRSEWVLLKVWKNTPHPLWTPLHTTINTSSNPPLPHTCTTDQRRRCAPGLPEVEKERNHQAQIVLHQSVWYLCWPAGPHLHTDLQQITGTVASPFMLQMLHHHPHPKEIQNCRTKWLQACGSNVCGHEVFWKTCAGPPEGQYWPLLDPLQFAYRANRSVDDAVNMGLHYVLQHLDRPGTYVRILFVDFSWAFNTIIPNSSCQTNSALHAHLHLSVDQQLPNRQAAASEAGKIHHPALVRSALELLSVLSQLLFSLYTNDCTSKDPSVKLLKFADNTTLIGLNQDGDESNYRQEVKELAVWCSLNNLELNMLKTVEMIVDFRINPPALPHSPSWTALWLQWRHSGSWAPISPRTWVGHSQTPLLKRPSRGCTPSPAEKVQPATGAAETVLLRNHWIRPRTSITVWFSSGTKSELRRLQRVVRTAERITSPLSKNCTHPE